MKLTKAQRLFIQAGEAQSLMKDCAERGFANPTAKYRKLRKKLIREALRAHELERADAFTAGYEMCKSAHNISDEFMLIDGDIIF